MSSEINLVDLFCGAGGLSLGFQNLGLKIITALDNDKESIETYSHNINTKFKPLCNSINEIKPMGLLEYIKMAPKELDLLIGGPPCRSFSFANRQSNTEQNSFNNLIYEYLEFIKIIKPKIFLLENVIGLINFQDGVIYNDFLQKIKKLKYIVNKYIFSCENYGIPQKRERLIIIGTRRRKKIDMNIRKQKKIPVKDAINDLPDLFNGNRKDPLKYKKNTNLSHYQEKIRSFNSSEKIKNNLVTKNNEIVIQRYKHIPPGGNWRNIPLYLMKNYSKIQNCHSSIYYRLDPDIPSITICNFRKNMLIHPYQDRGLSVREAARLQSFPDNYIFRGGLGSQQQQVANAVPPILSSKIAYKIKNYLES